MNIQKKLERWTSEGFLTEEQARTIARFEDSQISGSWVLFGISALGITVLLTGVVSIIAANWADISAAAKLSLYFISLVALGFAAIRRSAVAGIMKEGLFLAFSLYLLAGIGLISQVYNLQGDGYKAIFFWLVITLPLALLAKSKPLCHAWFLGLAVSVPMWATHANHYPFDLRRFFIMISVPYLCLAIGYGFAHRLTESFGATARIWGYLTILLPISIMGNLSWAGSAYDTNSFVLNGWMVTPAIGCLALAGVLVRKIQKGSFLTYVISGTILLSQVLILVPLLFDIDDHEVIGCALFIATWAGAAAIAAGNYRKRLFDLAAFGIGVRFVIVYFEVFGSLAATGVGLIISGLVILSVAYGWHRFRGDVAVAIQEQV